MYCCKVCARSKKVLYSAGEAFLNEDNERRRPTTGAYIPRKDEGKEYQYKKGTNNNNTRSLEKTFPASPNCPLQVFGVLCACACLSLTVSINL